MDQLKLAYAGDFDSLQVPEKLDADAGASPSTNSPACSTGPD